MQGPEHSDDHRPWSTVAADDDIEWELTCCGREAATASLDFGTAATTRATTERACALARRLA